MSVRMNKNGNSTIMVTLDSTPLAFAVLYMCYASKQLTEEQFHQAVQQLSAFHKKNIEEQMDTIHRYSPPPKSRRIHSSLPSQRSHGLPSKKDRYNSIFYKVSKSA
ncbi:hypothetical protein [Paenibacillus larvae]|uniref:Uncharacterized protein n=1 Tax=Paenibacillus larvae subsp. larvae DSM 25430 TaxID=697284 RepID=V9VZ23_9BACL|nr:hypothetical protein [Paenibacillus larvae]AHD03906.1 hypothetical protein ERIC2_c00280 [Paenibacillus larvae subsp. larvae DSM 25430]AVG10511.1 hypothetical protein ERICII_00031 [Paenibacillus larvae subsp. larvae DSM 25430]MDR5567695.1 hypothetical protein [Paenibacillus larvae]MDR5594300.1 hypothetical protein [Paenibacillus larvae]